MRRALYYRRQLLVAYSFKPRFVAPILAGTKRQTIRAERTGRSRHARPGEEVQIYTGMRTARCKLIGKATCREVWEIAIHIPEGMIKLGPGAGLRILHTRSEMDLFAQHDGFSGWSAMREFWWETHKVDEFRGVVISWGDLL